MCEFNVASFLSFFLSFFLHNCDSRAPSLCVLNSVNQVSRALLADVYGKHLMERMR